MTPPLFLVEASRLAEVGPGGRILVDGDEGRHAAVVRRLRAGEQVWVGDGAGRVVEGEVADVTRHSMTVAVQRIRDVSASSLRFVVVQALARGGRDEAAVEAMTEVGVDEIIGWAAERSVAKWTDRTLARWEATARAATKQSRRAWVPRIEGPVDTAAVADRLAAAAVALVLDGDAEARLADVEPPAPGDVLVVVGPEGGISPEELRRFEAAGAVRVRLGDEILRASTAGVVALAALSARSRWS